MSNDLIYFNSIGTFFNVNTGILHPAWANGTVDFSKYMECHILECDLYEVRDNLDDVDEPIFMAYFDAWKNKL